MEKAKLYSRIGREIVQWGYIPEMQEHFQCAEASYLICLWMVYRTGCFTSVLFFVVFSITPSFYPKVYRVLLSRSQPLVVLRLS